MIERTNSSDVTLGFPVYDAHGNNVATLSRSGAGYAVNDRRVYSAWGDIRGAGQLGDPKGRYCASLGHRADDESGFIYMRARYYEPTSGRFISEDTAMDGANWFVYCGNDPVNCVDSSGRTKWTYFVGAVAWLEGMRYLLMADALILLAKNDPDIVTRTYCQQAAVSHMTSAATAFSFAFACTDPAIEFETGVKLFLMSQPMQRLISTVLDGLVKGSHASGSVAVFAVASYSMLILGVLAASAND